MVECLDTGSGLIIVQLQELAPSVKLFIDFDSEGILVIIIIILTLLLVLILFLIQS